MKRFTVLQALATSLPEGPTQPWSRVPNNEIEFAVNIYPSMAKRGHHAVAITNNGDESLVIGFTDNPELTKAVISSIIKSEAGWSHDDSLNTHTLEVATSCVRAS